MWQDNVILLKGITFKKKVMSILLLKGTVYIT